MLYKTCENLSCGKLFGYYPSNYRKYCSRNCCTIAQTGEGNPFFGRKHSEESKAKSRLHPRLKGSNHPNWKGGIKHNKEGYLRDTNDKFIHRIVMEKFIERELLPNEVVHHKNGNVSDNRLDNLELYTNSDHRKFHVKTQLRDSKGKFTKKRR